MKCWVGAVAAALLTGEAFAAGQIYYGSRIGMTVTIREMSGINSENAQIVAEHTRRDARSFCVEYANDKSESCIRDTLKTVRLSDRITANCKTGVFNTFHGGRYVFRGLRKSKVGNDMAMSKYSIVYQGEELDGSGASGYSYVSDQFRALCPSRFDPAD